MKPWVYPRVCGGTAATSWRPTPHSGLSPRVRGNHLVAGHDVLDRGSIPACAGEPVGGGDLRGAWRVYPRVCGGTNRNSHMALTIKGLSPRVRGNPVGNDGGIAPHGSIPACAGEPRSP